MQSSVDDPTDRPRTQTAGVDDVWRSLKASSTKNEHFERIWLGIKSDAKPRGVVKQTVTSDPVQAYFRLGPPGPDLKSDENDIKCNGRGYDAREPCADGEGGQPGRRNGSAGDRERSGGTPLLDAEALEQRLVAADADVRRAALKHIQSALAAAEATTTFAPLLKPLLRRFDDAAEANREAAAACAHAILAREPDAVLALMPYVMPVLEERMARKPQGPTEPCEEVRLLLARLLALVLSEAGLAARGYAAEAVRAVEAALADAYHEVNVAGCEAVVALTVELGERLQPAARRLAAALLPLTTHTRHRVRGAALHALRPLAHAGGHELILDLVGHRDPCLVPLSCFYGDPYIRANFAGRLAADPNQLVRLEFVETVADWMLRLRERRDHEGRLLPFVLAALADAAAPAAAAAAARALADLGAQYEAERAAELDELRAYCPEALEAAAGQPDDAEWGGLAVHLPGGAAGASLQAGHEQQQQQQQPLLLRVGSRMLVQDNASRLLPPLCGELCSWQDAPRAKCAALLRAVLALLGRAIERHLELLLPALLKAMARGDPSTRADVQGCCAVASRGAPLGALLAVLLPRARAAADDGADEDATLAAAAALQVLAHALRGAGSVAARRAEVGAECPRLLELLEHPCIAHSRDARVRRARLEVAAQLVAACPRGALAAAAPRLVAVLALMVDAGAAAAGVGGGAAAAAEEGRAENNGLLEPAALLQRLAAVVAGSDGHEEGESSSSSSGGGGGGGGSANELMRRHQGEVMERVTRLLRERGGRRTTVSLAAAEAEAGDGDEASKKHVVEAQRLLSRLGL